MIEDRAQVRVLPPLIPLAAIGLGTLAHLALPVAIGPGTLVRSIGAAFLVVSIVIVATAARELAKARTTFDVRRTTTALVRSGVFRMSRNPVYLSMMLLGFAVAFLANSLPIALVMFPAGSALCLAIIRPEEQYLEAKFGEDYREYRSTVRRWI